MQATEELFHLTNDPLEMTNLASNPEYQAILETMREEYDGQVTHWDEQSVDYNGYKEYGILFDPSVDWETKKRLIESKDAKMTLSCIGGSKTKMKK